MAGWALLVKGEITPRDGHVGTWKGTRQIRGGEKQDTKDTTKPSSLRLALREAWTITPYYIYYLFRPPPPCFCFLSSFLFFFGFTFLFADAALPCVRGRRPIGRQMKISVARISACKICSHVLSLLLIISALSSCSALRNFRSLIEIRKFQ